MKARLYSITKAVLILTLIFAVSCNKDENKNPSCEIISPTDNQEIVKGQTVHITVDASDGDGTVEEVQFSVDETGIGSSVSFPYSFPWTTLNESIGTRIIKIKCLDNDGGSSEDQVSINLIDAGGPPVANFSSANPCGLVPHTVSFADESANYPISWLWYFGDGGISTEQNPSYTYQSPGDYTVSLMVTNLLGTDELEKVGFVRISNGEPAANFTSDLVQGVVPLSVSFSDISSFDPTNWFWDFGDGNTSTERNPIHIYTIEGDYTVSLIAENAHGTDTIKKSGFIIAEPFMVSDYDGNVYSTIIIGNQTWMKENLYTTHYSDGTPIPHISDNTEWAALEDNFSDKAYCYYNNDAGSAYGVLYTFGAVLNGENPSGENPSGVQGICPTGWHLPSDNEWKQLEIFLGMSESTADLDDFRGTDEGGKLKGSGTSHWESPNTGATNLSNFTALPGGTRHTDGLFYHIKLLGYWWSSTSEIEGSGVIRELHYSSSKVGRFSNYSSGGLSVRCVKD